MRIKIIYTIVIIVWSIILGRVYYLSVQYNEYYQERALRNVEKIDYLPPVRGEIYDRKHRPIALNKLGFSVALAPHLRRLKSLDKEVDNLIKIFPDLDKEKILKEYIKEDSSYNQNFITVIDFIDYDEMHKKLSLLNLNPNIQVEAVSKRLYPNSSLASHVIGYVGKSNEKDIENNLVAKLTSHIGKTGIEAYYNELLQGKAGKRVYRINATHKVVQEVEKTLPTSDDITLSIDLELQKYINQLFKGKDGAAVVIDLKDGSVLAAGSYPEYDLNIFVNGISSNQWNNLINDLHRPFTNKLVNGQYPPGSVIKMGVGLSFIDSKKYSENSKILCDPYFELAGRKFRNWKAWGSDMMVLSDALRESCDTYFYRGSYEVGVDQISKTLKDLGFGVKTGVDLPNEFVGIVPNKEWKMQRYNQPWFHGETLNISIGQGSFLATPMQVAAHTALIATGDKEYPTFLKMINNEEIQPKIEKDFLAQRYTKSQIEAVRKGMYEVANHPRGTANKIFKGSIVPIAAKTGTAQVVGIPQNEIKRMKESDMEYYRRSHAWVTTYAPYKNPKFVVTVLVEHGGGGGATSGPIAKAIYKKLYDLGYLTDEDKK